MHPTVATEIGIMSALRTGDPVRDLALCAAVPLSMERLRESPHTLTTLAELVKERVGDVLTGFRTYTTHCVELVEQHGYHGEIEGTGVKSIDANDHRDLLFRAVSLYIADHVSLDGQWGRYGLFEKGQTKPLESLLKEDPLLAKRQSQVQHLLDSNRELTQLNVMALTPINRWIPVSPEIDMRYTEELICVDTKKSPLRTIRKKFVLRSRADDAPQQIRQFMDLAFEYYRGIEKRKVESDEKRYLYVRDTCTGLTKDSSRDSSSSSASKSAPAYKRYALGEEKAFETVFFDEKPAVIKLLDDFTNKTGKFAIEGFPNKLGLLLHGPPGTGKTSLIKAIAQHTKRHIVSISLSKIQTNQELLDAMTDLRFAVRGVTLPVKLTFEDVVFVMEDVDCASSVVKSRTDGEDTVDDPGVLVRQENGDATQPLALLAALLGDEELLMEHGLVASSNQNDKLNLAGLLNVLDGVIDCPGRIVVMTTNHPEKLDPALIRPGRVNKKIHLAWMPPHQIQLMLEYYFDTRLTDDQETRVLSLSETVTPAEVEEICAEYDDVEDAVTALEAKTDPLT